MRWLIAAVITVIFMTLSDSHFFDHVTCSDGNPAPYRISQPSTNDYVQIVSPDATQLTLMCSLNITIPSGMTITWLHDDRIEATTMTQDDQKINTVSLIKGRPRPSDAGVYQCVFNDTNGCTLSANITVEFQSSTITSALVASTTVIGVTDMVNVTYHSLTQSATHSLTTAAHALVTTIVTTSLIDLNVTAITISAHTVTQSTNHTASSVATTTDASSTTDITTSATKSADLSITAITNLANIATTFTISPTLSPSQPDSNSTTGYFSVGILVAVAVVLVVVFVIITIVVVGIIVVCCKRKRSERCTKQEDADYSITDEKLSQRPPASIPETVKLERQDNKNPNTKLEKTIMEDHYYSIPFENQLKMQHVQINIQANPAYTVSSGINTPNYYNVNTACYKHDTG